MSNWSHEDCGFFLLRTPLLPVTAWIQWGEGLASARAAESDGLGKALDADVRVLRERLRVWVADPVVREALLLASRSLDEGLPRWLDAPESEPGRRIERTLVKYFGRMASRCTPFGLFAGFSTGTIGTEARLQLCPRSDYRRHCKADMGFLAMLSDRLARDPGISAAVRFRPNSSLHWIGDRVQYAESQFTDGHIAYYLVGAGADSALKVALECAAGGARLDEIAAAVTGLEVTPEEATEYVHQLVDGSLLVPDLAPAVTGPDALGELVAQLQRIDGSSAASQRLARFHRELQALSLERLGTEHSRYRDIAAQLDEPAGARDLSRLFHVDLTKPSALTLDRDLVESIATGVRVMHGLFGALPSTDGLKEFRQRFRERYDDLEVPLAEALDDEIGIGMLPTGDTGGTETLLEGVVLPGGIPEPSVNVTAASELVALALYKALAAGREEISLLEENLEAARRPDALPLPDSFAVLGSILPPDSDAEGSAPRFWISSAHGPPAARLLGRFCLADSQLAAEVRRLCHREQELRPEVKFFEIVHLPEGRMGNVIARPVLREYEFPYLGRSLAPPERQLDVAELTLRLEGDRLVLRSTSLDCEVVPRLCSAHNTSLRTVGLYRFLAALQWQGLTYALTWSWRELSHLPFLPRVTYGRLVLAPKAWNLNAEEIAGLSHAAPEARFTAVQRWRRKRKIPRHIGVMKGTAPLCVDLDNPLSVDCLIDDIRRQRTATVVELFLNGNTEPVTGPEGRFSNEVIVPFIRTAAGGSDAAAAVARAGTAHTAPNSAPDGRRGRRNGTTAISRRAPGSDWLYLKIYCGPATADRILCDAVFPVVETLVSSGVVARWFFVRYLDPEHHLRIRFQGEPGRLWSQALAVIHNGLAETFDRREIWRIQLDTYQREVTRYGGPEALERCESIFHADSDAVSAALTSLGAGRSTSQRWLLALKGIESMLDDFGLDLPRRYRFMHELSEDMAREQRLLGRRRKPVLEKYRLERKNIEAVLGEGAGGDHAYARRSNLLRPLVTSLHDLEREGKLTQPIDAILRSVIHMHVNRTLRGNSRAQEMVLYQFLDRHFESRLARAAIKGSGPRHGLEISRAGGLPL